MAKLLEWEQCKLLAYYSKKNEKSEENKFSWSCLWVYFYKKIGLSLLTNSFDGYIGNLILSLYRLDIVVKAMSPIRLYSHVGHKCSF